MTTKRNPPGSGQQSNHAGDSTTPAPATTPATGPDFDQIPVDPSLFTLGGAQ